MPWNEPDKKDPWGKRPKQDGPPDLDELLKKLQRKINAFFGGKKTPVPDGNKKVQGPGFPGAMILAFVVGIVILVWVLSGIYIVSPQERSAVLRFGKYASTAGPGPHWIPRFIESKYTLNVQNIATYPYQAEMLTKDENIVSVSVAVQYRIGSVREYLFSAVDPRESLQQATASALRQVIGQTTLDEVLTTGRERVREQVVTQLRDILARYHVGVVITDVTLLPAKPPEAVTEAFDDVNKAREDEQRFINQAEAYQQKVVPIAKGQAGRLLREAKAYKAQVILQAEGDTAKFLALLPQYEKSPKVLKERIYLNTIESVLRHSSKILVDLKGGNNILYLPLDKLVANSAKSVTGSKIMPEDITNKITDPTENSAVQLASDRPSRVGYTGGALE